MNTLLQPTYLAADISSKEGVIALLQPILEYIQYAGVAIAVIAGVFAIVAINVSDEQEKAQWNKRAKRALLTAAGVVLFPQLIKFILKLLGAEDKYGYKAGGTGKLMMDLTVNQLSMTAKGIFSHFL